MTTNRRITRPLHRVGAVVLLLAALALSTSAQTNKAAITGTVTDQNGGTVSGATVVVVNVDTNAERTVTTSDEGSYEVPSLDPGNYRVTVSAPNFKKTIQENVKLETAARQPVDVVLETGDIGAQVTVTAAQQLVESETSDRGSVVTGREVTELPLSGRNFTLLATLTPGVARAVVGTLSDPGAFNNGDPNAGNQGPGGNNSNGNTESARFARSGGANLTVNGQRPTNNNFSLDGVDNNEPQFGTIGVYPNPDAIAEFKVTTSVPPAEVGRAGGAVINVTMKPGTNEFHGSAYYYGQNSALNAYHPILKRNRAEAASRGDLVLPVKAQLQIHEFGGTLGGPIFKDRTFFFVDYLGQRNNLPIPFNTDVPTSGSRNGDFSQFDKIVRDPRTGLPFPGNVIPPGRVIAPGRNYLNTYPLPTVNIRNPGQFCDPCNGANFFGTRDNQESINNFGVKIDHRFSENNTLNGRFNFQDTERIRANYFPATATAGFGAGEEFGNSRQLTISDTHTFSPSALNEFRFGFTKIDIKIFNCGVGGGCGVSPTYASDIGIPNVNDGSLERSGGSLIGNTGAGFLEFTGDGGLFAVTSKNPYFADTVTIVHGKHVSKFGGELRLRYLDSYDGGRNGGVKGQFQYNDTDPIANPLVAGQVCPPESLIPGGEGSPARCFVDPSGFPYGGSGNSQANILLGVGANFVSNANIPGGTFHLRSQEYGLFVQDDWKITDRLTLNLGLRYDLFPGATERDGRQGNFDIDARQVVIASGAGDRLISTDKNNFGPRLGFAYAMGDEKKFVVRGGFGLLYTLDGVDDPPLIRNPPFSNQISIGSNAFDAGGRTTTFNFLTGPPAVPVIDPANIPTNVVVYYQQPNQKIASVYQFQLSFQYQLSDDYSIDIGYVGNRSRHLLATRDLGAGGTAQARNRSGQFLDALVAYEPRASSQYDGFQAQLQKRLSNNIQGQISYTWSHTIDDSTGVFNGIGDARGSRGGPANPFNFRLDRGNSSLDIRHLLSANTIIDLPFGQGKRYLNQGGYVNKIFGGFQLNIITSARSGFPFTVNANGDVGGPGGGATVRATQIGDPFANVPAGRYMNFAAFNTSTSCVTNAAGRSICSGSIGRNTFRGPAIFNTDSSLFKNTKLSEKVVMQIGIEAFNIFNHANYTVPNNNASDTGAFGRLDAAYPGRIVQYRFKLLF